MIETNLVRLSGRDELRDDPVDDVGRGEEVEQDLREDLAKQGSLVRTQASNAVEEDGHPLHGLHQQLRVGVEVAAVVVAAVVVAHGVHARQEELEGRNHHDWVRFRQQVRRSFD